MLFAFLVLNFEVMGPSIFTELAHPGCGFSVFFTLMLASDSGVALTTKAK